MQEDTMSAVAATLSVFIHAAFDTGIIIDTLDLEYDEFRRYSAHTISHLQQIAPAVKWMAEDPQAIRGADDPTDFLPVVNLSFVTAIDPTLALTPLELRTPSGAVATLTFTQPLVYFHAFAAGVISTRADFTWDRAYSLDDVRYVNNNLLSLLGPLVEKQLGNLIALVRTAVQQAQLPLFTPPFVNITPATTHRDLLYWSHFVYVARPPRTQDIAAVAAWFAPFMMPVDQAGVQNMALKPNRFIFLGWGRSLCCFPRDYAEENIYSYVRVVEIRNYLWKILYDLDRSLRDAVRQGNIERSRRKARHLISQLRGLDFRVKAILEELDSFKVTFDHEKIFLIKQLDKQWMTPDLIHSVESRLDSFSQLYTYNEDAETRERDERLQFVLNIIGVVATAGAVTEIINYFDPTYHLPTVERADFFIGSMAVAILAFVLGTTLLRPRRKRRP
jgi:hypothetical protein